MIETAAGKRRCAANQWTRIWKGRRRAKRVNRLCKINSEAQKLTMTGIQPVQVYGNTAQGASTAQVNAMCTSLKVGTVMGKTQACAISTVAWFFGEKRVPKTATRVEKIRERITMWRGFIVDTRRRIRKVWMRKAHTLAKDPRRWNQATGPISATICSVLEAGWKPSTPGFWQSPEASATLDGALFNKAQIIDSFSKDMDMQTWKRAAGHSLSTGMEKGIIIDFAKKARSQLIKDGNFMAARALDFLVFGAINEPHLPADGSFPKQFFCVRCDQRTLATRKHELWECPGNKLINHTHMKESDHPVTLAHKFWDTDQVLFARGLLPRDWLPASELAECSEIRMWESSCFKVCASDNVLITSDGSRDSRETPKSVRQVAFGVATFSLQPLSDTSFKLLRTGFLGGHVPCRQTVARAELWGAIQILSRVDEKSNAKYVTRGITHRGDLEQGPNVDLWSILFHLIDERSGVTDVIEVKSHLEDVGPSVITQNKIGFHHMLANSLADVVAEEAAKRLLPELNLERKAKKAERIGIGVAKRLALVQADKWAKRGAAGDIYELETLVVAEETRTRSAIEKMVNELAQQGHLLIRHNRGLKCRACNMYHADRQFSFWYRNPCVPLPCAAEVISQVRNKKRPHNESFEKEPHPYTSSVSQDIPSTHSHMERLSQPVSSETEGDLANTQQSITCASPSQVGEQCHRSRCVLGAAASSWCGWQEPQI